MAKFSYSEGFKSANRPSKSVKAVLCGGHNLIDKMVDKIVPEMVDKIVPEDNKSIEIIEQAGGVKIVCSAESSGVKYANHKVEAVGMNDYQCKYTLRDGIEIDWKICIVLSFLVFFLCLYLGLTGKANHSLV